MSFDPDHDALMVHFAVDTLAVKLNRAGGYLDRLKAAIDAGDEIGADEPIARILAADVRTLDALSASIAQIRLALIGNATPQLKLAAE